MKFTPNPNDNPLRKELALATQRYRQAAVKVDNSYGQVSAHKEAADPTRCAHVLEQAASDSKLTTEARVNVRESMISYRSAALLLRAELAAYRPVELEFRSLLDRALNEAAAMSGDVNRATELSCLRNDCLAAFNELKTFTAGIMTYELAQDAGDAHTHSRSLNYLRKEFERLQSTPYAENMVGSNFAHRVFCQPVVPQPDNPTRDLRKMFVVPVAPGSCVYEVTQMAQQMLETLRTAHSLDVEWRVQSRGKLNEPQHADRVLDESDEGGDIKELAAQQRARRCDYQSAYIALTEVFQAADMLVFRIIHQELQKAIAATAALAGGDDAIVAMNNCLAIDCLLRNAVAQLEEVRKSLFNDKHLNGFCGTSSAFDAAFQEMVASSKSAGKRQHSQRQ